MSVDEQFILNRSAVCADSQYVIQKWNNIAKFLSALMES